MLEVMLVSLDDYVCLQSKELFEVNKIRALHTYRISTTQAFLIVVSKESACNAGDQGLIPGAGRSSGEGNGNPPQYSCLENPMHRGAWQATVHGVARVGHDLVTKPPPSK